MRKKYLSALLFGALLFASTGTFTSCKDYDDDISDLQEQITANANAIKSLQTLVDNGDYVTGVEKTADGILFTFSKSGSKTIALEDKVGSVVTVQDGVLYIDGEATEIKVAEPAPEVEEHKDQIIIENNMWSVLQEDGTYKSTGIPVSGVTAVENAKKQWVVTIYNADGSKSEVVIPSAASVMSDLVLAGWIDASAIDDKGNLSTSAINTAFSTDDQDEYTGTLDVEYSWIEKVIATYDKDKEITWSAQKTVTKGQVLTTLAPNGIQLVTRVAPADLDLSSMKFTLQDSKGNVLPITLKSATNFTGTLTRAANSSINLIPLDITSDTYNKADDYAKLYGDDDVLYSLVEESGARSNYGLAVTAEKATVSEQKVVKVDGKEVNDSKQFEVDLNKANKLTFGEDPEYVYDYYVEPVDQAVADLFGVQINKENGTFTVTKLSDQITRTTFNLYVYALHIDGKVYRSEITIKPSNKIVAAATLAAGEQVIKQSVKSDGKTVDEQNFMKFDISLDAMFNEMSAEDKAKWTSSILGANAGLEIDKVKVDGKDAELPNATEDKSNYYKIVLLDKDGKGLSNNEAYKATSLRVYAKYATMSTPETATLQPGKDYELTINFNHENTDKETELLNTVKLTYTPVLPALSDYMVKHPSFWNSDQTVLLGVDNSINETFISKGKTLNYVIKDGFKTLGSTGDADEMAITFELADDKVDNQAFVQLDADATDQTVKYTAAAKDNKNYGKEFTVKVKEAKYLGVYDYSADDKKAQTFKMQVLSPIVEGEIKVKEGTAVEVYASRNAKLDIADLIGYNYNKQTYNLYMDVYVNADTDNGGDTKKAYEISSAYKEANNYADKSIASVKFESGDTQVFQITEDMKPVTSSQGTPATWNGKSVDTGYVTLDTSNISQNTETTIKVTVTDIWGYEKTVEVPLLIKMAE